MTLFDIYVINLDKDKDRMNQIEKHLYPHPFIRIPGIYGKEIDMEKYDEIFSLSKYFAPKSAIGCSLSHRRAIETFLRESKNDWGVILEDDAIPVHDKYMDEIQKSIQNAPQDWDIINLDYYPNYSRITTQYNSLLSVLKTAYIINKQAAKSLLQKNIYYYPDTDLNLYRMNVYNNPTIVFYQNWYSNGSNNMKYSNPFGFFNYNVFRVRHHDFSLIDILSISFIFFSFLFVYKIPKSFYKKIGDATVSTHVL